jgi:hypothetical protein
MQLQASFHEIDGVSVRFDEDSMMVSVYDVCQVVTGKDNNRAAEVMRRLFKQWPEFDPKAVNAKSVNIQFPGQGQRPTPVADAAVMIELVWLMPGRKAKEFRASSAVEICRTLGGDETLIEEIRYRQRNLNPKTREFYRRGADRTGRNVEWYQDRKESIETFHSLSDAVANNVPKPSKWDYIAINGEISRAALGEPPKNFRRRMGLSKNKSTRPYFNKQQQAATILMQRLVEDSQNKNPGRELKDYWPEVKNITDSIFTLMADSGQHGKHLLVAPPAKKVPKKSEPSNSLDSHCSGFGTAKKINAIEKRKWKFH